MHVEALKDQLRARPFRPFRLVLATGETLEVRHPEMLALGNRTAVMIDSDDRTHYIDVALVVKLEVAPPAPAGRPRPEADEG